MFYIFRIKLFYFICALISVFIIILWFHLSNHQQKYHIFKNFNNISGSNSIIIPNNVHYISFNQTSLSFITYLSILSVLKVQKPEQIIIHGDNKICNGIYWEKLEKEKNNTNVLCQYMPQPTHAYGQPLSSIYHVSDVARIYILQKNGGIYLDTDVVVINNLNGLRYFEMVVGWPENEYMGTQVLLANKSARFLNLWLESYRTYHPRNWYYNAGQFPTEVILKYYPQLVHRERLLLGVHNLLDKLHTRDKWDDWKMFYTIHLLSRHHSVTKHFNEDMVNKLDTNFGNIVKWILTK